MRCVNWAVVYPLFVLSVAGYVWWSNQMLPDVVASHFGASGQANGFMPREAYGRFMAGLIAVLPVFVVYLPNMLMRRAVGSINLPNRDYWLAPQRREQTLESLCRGSFGFGYLLVGFLGYVHQVVLMANRAVPPGLPSAWFIGGLIAFVVATLVWAFVYLRRFFRVPRGSA